MNCVEAQKHFADLLDHSRDERLRKVNDHLTACARCTEEFAALAACQQLVSGLPPVEPPVGFTTRVMAEIRDTVHRPNTWQRLFSRIPKIPLQAMAVILIGVLAVFIYQKESSQPEWTTTVPPASPLQKHDEEDKLPAGGGAPAPDLKVKESGEAGAQARRMKRSPQTEQLPSLAESQEQSNTIGGVQPGAGKVAPPPASVNPAKVAPSKPKEESSPADETGSVRQEQSLRSGGAQAEGLPSSAPLRDNDTAAGDRTAGGASASSAGLEEKRARSSLDALSSSTTVSSDHELILRLKQPARDDKSTAAPPELERSQAGPSPSQAQLKHLDQGRQRAIETGQPQTVWTMIDASQYEGFKKELAGLGNIESELAAPAHKNAVKPAAQLRIKVTILPPLSSADYPSSR